LSEATPNEMTESEARKVLDHLVSGRYKTEDIWTTGACLEGLAVLVQRLLDERP